MAYVTKCPKCGVMDRLAVVAGSFAATKMPLTEDGFSFEDAKNVDTSNEVVECQACETIFSLSDLTGEEYTPRKYAIDLPNPRDPEDAMVNYDYYDDFQAASRAASAQFGADETGLVQIISPMPEEEEDEETDVCH